MAALFVWCALGTAFCLVGLVCCIPGWIARKIRERRELKLIRSIFSNF